MKAKASCCEDGARTLLIYNNDQKADPGWLHVRMTVQSAAGHMTGSVRVRYCPFCGHAFKEDVSIWLLKPIYHIDGDWTISKEDPRVMDHNVHDGFVIRAVSEKAARQAVVDLVSSSSDGDVAANMWLDPNHTTCQLVTGEGEDLVLSSYQRG